MSGSAQKGGAGQDAQQDQGDAAGMKTTTPSNEKPEARGCTSFMIEFLSAGGDPNGVKIGSATANDKPRFGCIA